MTISAAQVRTDSAGNEQKTDGTAPWDNDDEAGNDSSASNGIVRSFDEISYMVEYVTALTDPTNSTSSAKVKVELTLPATPTEAQWNMNAMGWMTDSELTYVYEDGSTSTTYDKNKNVKEQRLIGYRVLKGSSADNSVPGAGQLSVGIAVKGAVNGFVVAPSMTLQCVGDDVVRDVKLSTTKVSAAPQYDVQVVGNSAPAELAAVYVDDDTGTMALHKTSDSEKRARLYGTGIAISLRNNLSGKGLKGIELPTDTFTFDIEVTSTLDGATTEIDGDWEPILWNYGSNGRQWQRSGHPSRISDDTTHEGTRFDVAWGLPSGISNGTAQASVTTQNGTWTIERDESNGRLYHVTVSGFGFDTDTWSFPYWPYDHSSYTSHYADEIGYFSTGYIQWACTMPDDVESTLSYNVNFHVTNMQAESQSGQVADTSTGANVLSNNDSYGTGVVLYGPGRYTQYVYMNCNWSAWNAGDGYSLRGVSHTLSNKVSFFYDDSVKAYDIFTKIDTDALEFTGTHTNVGVSCTASDPGEYRVLWGAKPDGTGWSSYEEAVDAQEENLVYYESLDALKAAGKVCVAALCEGREADITADASAYWIQYGYKVKEDAEVGHTAWAMMCNRAWLHDGTVARIGDHVNDDGTFGYGDSSLGRTSAEDPNNITFADGYTTPDLMMSESWKNSDGSVYNYVPAQYKDGAMVSGHTGGVYHGDSALIIGAQNSVSVKVADLAADGQSTKTIYDLDAGERTARLRVDGSMSIQSSSGAITTATGDVTMTVTLPSDLHYIEGSATVEPESVSTAADGTTTLTFVLEDQQTGQSIPVEFSTTIGAAGTPQDVDNNQNLNVVATITSTLDQRRIRKGLSNYSETSLSVVKLAAISLGKAVNREHGNIGDGHVWTLNVMNSSEVSMSDMDIADVLPEGDGKDGRGSSFSGDYKIRSITVDATNAPSAAGGISSSSLTTSSSSAAYSAAPEDLLSGAAGGFETSALSSYSKEGSKVTWKGEAVLSAFRLHLSVLGANESVSITVECDTSTEANDGDVWKNQFYEYATSQAAVVTSNIVETDVANLDVEVSKSWEDADDADGIRPSSATFTLTGSDGSSREMTCTSAGGWNASLEDLPMYDEDGGVIAYELMEKAVDGYTTAIEEVDGEYKTTYTATNTHEQERISIPVSKAWSDDDNRDGIRPDDVTVHLTGSDGSSYELTIDADDGWKGTFKELPKNMGGKAITYALSEDVPDGYKATTSGSTSSGYTITNTHDIETVSVPVSKVWDDADDADKLRPSSVTIALTGSDGSSRELELTALNSWKGSFTGLPKNQRVNGETKAIAYTASEKAVPDGYTGSCSYSITAGGWIATNTHEQAKISIPVSKTWDDDGDRDGIRPSSVTVVLSGSDGSTRSLEIASAGDWKGEFTDLPKNKSGKAITYTLTEDAVDGYTTTVSGSAANGFSVKNTHEIETIEIPVSKLWDDDEDADGMRPGSVTVVLSGSDGSTRETTITSAGDWKGLFEDLPKNMSVNGTSQVIAYTVSEKDVPDGYTYKTRHISDAKGWEITNTHERIKTEVSVKKIWDDDDDRDRRRPTTLAVTISGSDGTVKHATLSSATGWAASFDDLPAYTAGGKEISYSVVEDLGHVDGYTASSVSSGDAKGGWTLTLTNMHEIATTSVEIDKEWDDDDDRDGLRRDCVFTITGKANGQVVETRAATLKKGTATSVTVEGLPVFYEGHLVDYSVSEASIDGYETEIYQPGVAWDVGYRFVATNKHTPAKVDIPVSKSWIDVNDADGLRPSSIEVSLTGSDGSSYQKTITAGDGWSYVFSDLPKNASGKEIAYQVSEKAVDEYAVSYETASDGSIEITNTHERKLTAATVSKIWDDEDDQDGKRPDELAVTLRGTDGTERHAILSAENDWKVSFDDLPAYTDGGKEISYTAFEDESVDGYAAKVEVDGSATEGWTIGITNEHGAYETSITVEKVWDDDDDRDGLRRDCQFTVFGKVGSDVVEERTLTLDKDVEGCSVSASGLPVYHEGHLISWSVEEAEMEGYEGTVEQTGDSWEDGYVFKATNIHEPETISIPVNKTWDDGNDVDSLRPASIEVILSGSDGSSSHLVLSADDGWEGSFDDLFKYSGGGHEIAYSIEETPVDGYVAKIVGNQVDGWEITNVHEPVLAVQDDIEAIASTGDDVMIKSMAVAIAAAVVAALALMLARRKR